ncbi:glycosyl hydrolase family protein [Striga asiatica]|uniref:Glycosyl hydrolase family protein n=1 Tax=Striga asiatica TaxID=4170 RepID=A0A5A7P2C1_STRAF|nr:glycosyl hydrolase family protein [Striga asiatica]
MGKAPSLLLSISLCCFWIAISNAEYAIYQNPKQPISKRIKDLLVRMTLEEKIGQMAQIDLSVATPEVVKKYKIGSVLSGGISTPSSTASPETWIDIVNGFQKASLSTRLKIPTLYGIDAVHGHSDVYRATIFPHNVGLGATRQLWGYIGIKTHQNSRVGHEFALLRGCLQKVKSWWGKEVSRDPQLVKRIGAATALEVRATGIHFAFAPCVAVCRDPRWGRCLESFSEDTKLVQEMTEIIAGLQGDIPHNFPKGVPFIGGQEKVLASAKHFVADGGTMKGINENNTLTKRHDLLRIHMPPYYTSIIKGVGTIMISYSSWNGVKMHANRDLITGFLKNTLKFRGFVISDWLGIDKITTPPHANYTYSLLAGVGAGIDMIMIPYNYTEFIDGLTSLVKNNFIPITRIDDAVRRILRVKFIMGLFEHPLADYSKEHRELAREAVRKSLVLLKNGESADKPLLPLSKKASKILVAGTHANNIGNQCGGWTIEWQGKPGNITNAVDHNTKVVYRENPDTTYVKSNNFSYAIVVVGEKPYAETRGDSLNLTIPEPGPTIITNVCASSVKCIVVLVTGRPVVIQPYLWQIDALVAAWLPGTEGHGVADVLFGDYGFGGKLPRTWFKTVDQLPMNVGDRHYDPLFPFGIVGSKQYSV